MSDTTEFHPCLVCVRDPIVLSTCPPQYRWNCIVCGGGYTSTDIEYSPAPPRISVEDLRPAPTMGRIVRYTPAPNGPGVGLDECPAIVTAVPEPDVVHLQVFSTTQVYPVFSVPHSDESLAGHWHWPPSGQAFYLPSGESK